MNDWSRKAGAQPALFSWGVGSTTCQPSNSGPRSSLLIQHSVHTWKFLFQAHASGEHEN